MVLSGDSVRLTAVNHLTYNAKDKERATKFWVETLGIKQIPSQVNVEHIIWQMAVPICWWKSLVTRDDTLAPP